MWSHEQTERESNKEQYRDVENEPAEEKRNEKHPIYKYKNKNDPFIFKQKSLTEFFKYDWVVELDQEMANLERERLKRI